MRNKILFLISFIALVSCSDDIYQISDDNHQGIDDSPNPTPITLKEKIMGRWMPVQTLLNDQVTYDRNSVTGLESDTHYQRTLYKDHQNVRISNNDGSIHLLTWELNSSEDSITIAKGQSNERRYLIEYASEDSLSISIEPFDGHKVVYSFIEEHDETTHRSDLIAKDWKYDLVWARLYSMDGYKYVRGGSVANDFYENAKVSFNNDGSFTIKTSNGSIHEQGTWYLNLDDMQLVIDGDYTREATLLELSENKMVFVFKNSEDNDINYQMDFSLY